MVYLNIFMQLHRLHSIKLYEDCEQLIIKDIKNRVTAYFKILNTQFKGE
jgi:hypothetical protein